MSIPFWTLVLGGLVCTAMAQTNIRPFSEDENIAIVRVLWGVSTSILPKDPIYDPIPFPMQFAKERIQAFRTAFQAQSPISLEEVVSALESMKNQVDSGVLGAKDVIDITGEEWINGFGDVRSVHCKLKRGVSNGRCEVAEVKIDGVDGEFSAFAIDSAASDWLHEPANHIPIAGWKIGVLRRMIAFRPQSIVTEMDDSGSGSNGRVLHHLAESDEDLLEAALEEGRDGFAKEFEEQRGRLVGTNVTQVAFAVKFVDRDWSPEMPGYYSGTADQFAVEKCLNWHQDTMHNWRRQSFSTLKKTLYYHPHMLTLDSSILASDTPSSSTIRLGALLAAHYADVPHLWDEGAYISVCYPEMSWVDWVGLGNIAGAFTWTTGLANFATVSHEHGHNAGLSHASFGNSEYGDQSDLMGDAIGPGDFGPSSKFAVGWLPFETIKLLDPAGPSSTCPTCMESTTSLFFPLDAGQVSRNNSVPMAIRARYSSKVDWEYRSSWVSTRVTRPTFGADRALVQISGRVERRWATQTHLQGLRDGQGRKNFRTGKEAGVARGEAGSIRGHEHKNEERAKGWGWMRQVADGRRNWLTIQSLAEEDAARAGISPPDPEVHEPNTSLATWPPADGKGVRSKCGQGLDPTCSTYTMPLRVGFVDATGTSSSGLMCTSHSSCKKRWSWWNGEDSFKVTVSLPPHDGLMPLPRPVIVMQHTSVVEWVVGLCGKKGKHKVRLASFPSKDGFPVAVADLGADENAKWGKAAKVESLKSSVQAALRAKCPARFPELQSVARIQGHNAVEGTWPSGDFLVAGVPRDRRSMRSWKNARDGDGDGEREVHAALVAVISTQVGRRKCPKGFEWVGKKNGKCKACPRDAINRVEGGTCQQCEPWMEANTARTACVSAKHLLRPKVFFDGFPILPCAFVNVSDSLSYGKIDGIYSYQGDDVWVRNDTVVRWLMKDGNGAWVIRGPYGDLDANKANYARISIDAPVPHALAGDAKDREEWDRYLHWRWQRTADSRIHVTCVCDNTPSSNALPWSNPCVNSTEEVVEMDEMTPCPYGSERRNGSSWCQCLDGFARPPSSNTSSTPCAAPTTVSLSSTSSTLDTVQLHQIAVWAPRPSYAPALDEFGIASDIARMELPVWSSVDHHACSLAGLTTAPTMALAAAGLWKENSGRFPDVWRGAIDGFVLCGDGDGDEDFSVAVDPSAVPVALQHYEHRLPVASIEQPSSIFGSLLRPIARARKSYALTPTIADDGRVIALAQSLSPFHPSLPRSPFVSSTHWSVANSSVANGGGGFQQETVQVSASSVSGATCMHIARLASNPPCEGVNTFLAEEECSAWFAGEDYSCSSCSTCSDDDEVASACSPLSDATCLQSNPVSQSTPSLSNDNILSLTLYAKCVPACQISSWSTLRLEDLRHALIRSISIRLGLWLEVDVEVEAHSEDEDGATLKASIAATAINASTSSHVRPALLWAVAAAANDRTPLTTLTSVLQVTAIDKAFAGSIISLHPNIYNSSTWLARSRALSGVTLTTSSRAMSLVDARDGSSIQLQLQGTPTIDDDDNSGNGSGNSSEDPTGAEFPGWAIAVVIAGVLGILGVATYYICRVSTAQQRARRRRAQPLSSQHDATVS